MEIETWFCGQTDAVNHVMKYFVNASVSTSNTCINQWSWIQHALKQLCLLEPRAVLGLKPSQPHWQPPVPRVVNKHKPSSLKCLLLRLLQLIAFIVCPLLDSGKCYRAFQLTKHYFAQEYRCLSWKCSCSLDGIVDFFTFEFWELRINESSSRGF